ncbi:MAG: bifunctional hydroxymethylpyrimidine kinase/phosphomethylpyrimidine kinase [Zunongwangia sp.]|uniref:hydroxymethylpyrimidine kinase n=2 Tax=Zunongwangia profunda TaxID=398743 RepID=D5BA01_ZUNPS|nr:bifunctional hydroxymethylpyrimidine kinase/phosphomethylpyrimidine kinase [Zunongwangia profunda]MAC65769.1 bifunctional hydroxymethylpyrimidine kinase/phosphomethylpyrimidine kinase [Flavobacteriaceae bacterium]MAO38360.1 bifunctional hydroxymethylpyrimidine kinase/phosphomethylpyrimidine kinase [Zunongwangia sp.]ADF52299.1 phosphomethylpyrimidine kinase [Zunongwangia profunda SM-A87]MAG87886.1 bifunctional hydroxymethylpyrimidine kinase/phosphomethylpyrimidine kinase [Flavobacteriaceae ba|tara:strand:- start:5675 stop:6508 length:834 start_codon:yes stop_codon:yes gene_type:complete
MKTYKYASALTIAGFDGSGGAGIQADIKTFSALGCYATSVLTALPVQNTTGVKNIFPIPYQAVSEQIDSIFEDIFPNAVKIGMVHTPELVESIVSALQKYPKTPLVFDPVMVATSGHKLIEDQTIETIIEKLFPLADVITPNMDEAAVLAKMKVENLADMKKAGEKIMNLGCKSVLMKGGHLRSDKITSLYFTPDGKVYDYEFEKFNTNNTHGSGCTLSSAIAAYLATGKNLIEAVKLGQEFAHSAIYHGKNVKTGKGNGPLNHFFNPLKLIKNELE